MKILVLGDSDSSGAFTGGESWATVFRAGVAEAVGEPVELVQAAFVPVGERAPGFVERRVAAESPELVVLPLGTYTFTAGFTWLRVRRLFGRRAGAWFRAVEERFNLATMERGRVRNALNRGARRAARAVIGTETLATMDECIEVYREIQERLSRAEHLDVLFVAYPMWRPVFLDPAVVAARHRYIGAVADGARRHHLVFCDGWEEMGRPEPGAQTILDDGLHADAANQRRLGEAATRVYLEWRASHAS